MDIDLLKLGFRVTASWKLHRIFNDVPSRRSRWHTCWIVLTSITSDWRHFATIYNETSFQSCYKMWICRLRTIYGSCMIALNHIFF